MSPYHEGMPLRDRIRRRIEWTLTTDFDPHDPIPPHKVRGIITLIIIILIAGGLKTHG